MSKINSSWVAATTYTFAGIGLSLLVSQLLWSQVSKYRLDSFATALLRHTEMVATDITSAMRKIEAAKEVPCSPADLSVMRRSEFEHGYIKDAGRIVNREIICSALWGKLKAPFKLTTGSTVTRSNNTLWLNTPNFAPGGKALNLTQHSDVFVATSPTAFSPFEDLSPELHAVLTTVDRLVLIKSFGDVIGSGDHQLRRESVRCSEVFDICVRAQIESNIFSKDRFSLLMAIASCGAVLGLLVFGYTKRVMYRSLTLEARLSAAIRSESIFLLYQPIICASTGALAGIEALARWRDDQLGDLRPDIFIAEANRIGMKTELNSNVIKRALREAAPLLQLNPEIYVSINIDVDALLDTATVELIKKETQNNGLRAEQVAIEILEGTTTDIKRMEGGIRSIRDAGYQVFIDDFGTGYSGLSYLGKLEVDKIKIDRMFTQAAGGESSASVILSMVIDMAKGINVGVVFEGIETEAQIQAILKEYPHALVQGWIYSKAVALKEIKTSYRSYQS